jgi:chemotaxis methyl-accepting protein methylase
MIPDGDPGLARVARHLAGHGGPPLASYKERCLRRRLAVRMRACGATSLSEYAVLLERSPEESRRLLEALTINVTEYFRNPEVWERLGVLLREMVVRRGGAIRAWSAGCAAGQEAYSLALLLHDLARQAGTPPPPRQAIDATDIDPGSLERARRARYPATAAGSHPLTRLLQREGDEVVVPGEIAALVRVGRHDLLREAPPAPPYDAILCRNVIIYFEREAQDRLLLSLVEALAPGGLLVLGRVESVLGPLRERLDLLAPRERIYRRAG